MVTIRILLLITALLGSLAAIGGETWKKDPVPFYKRVTLRGWIAVACMLSAFGLGVGKEVYSKHLNELAAANAERTQSILRQKLSDAEQKIAELKPAFERALAIATAGIPQEVDYPFYEAQAGTYKGTIVSSVSRRPLKLYAGQTLKYYIPGEIKGDPMFKIGEREYPIRENQGEITVIGIPGQAMNVEIIHPLITKFEEVREPRPMNGLIVKMVVRQVPVGTVPGIQSVKMTVSGSSALEAVNSLENVQSYLDEALKKFEE